MAHAREQIRKPPEERWTLGVAAFSVAQMDAILQQLELLRRQNPSCEEFFTFPPYEPFFVKNLENVQGDERDVIFISVGYGPDAGGYLTMHFGPLNNTGGERRLNVLISRARRRCEVFTALSADKIELDAKSPEGVRALKTFLAYAENGKLDLAEPTGRWTESVFEEQVLDALIRKGYKVKPQVGDAGFRLDLAVVDPERPGRYLLGIECDGAAYHSARSARDRDRLRQAVLEGLGWRIHRIWSTDWFNSSDKELKKAVDAIEAAKRESTVPPTSVSERIVPPAALAPTPDSVAIERPPRAAPPVAPIPKYQVTGLKISPGTTDLHLIDADQLANWLTQVVVVESPVHWLEAARRVANAAGVRKIGSRIEDAFRRACESASRAGRFAIRGKFLWRAGMTSPPLRDRSDFTPAAKKIEYVAPEEIRAAIIRAVEESYGLASDQVAGSACRLLGFNRVSEEMRTVVEKELDVLVAEGRLGRTVLKGETFVHADKGAFGSTPVK